MEKLIYQLLAFGVCSCTNCEECNKIFERDDCPRDDMDREEMLDFVTRLLEKLKELKNDKFYDLGEISLSEEDLIKFLMQ